MVQQKEQRNNMVQELAKVLIEKNLSICSAESLTGGLFGASISDISGISKVYFGSYNTQYGALGTVIDLPKIANSNAKIFGGINEDACDKLLADFFKGIRN